MAVTLTTSYKLPLVATQELAGSTLWSNLANVLLADGLLANGPIVTGADSVVLREVKLIIGGVVQATNKGTDAVIGGTTVYGGTSDTWSSGLTAAQANGTDFGVALVYGKDHTGTKTTLSYRMLLTNFALGIPSNATITGIQVKIVDVQTNLGGGSARGDVDYVQISITYSYPPRAQASGNGHAFIHATGGTLPKPQKKFRWLVYDHLQNFVGEWTKRVKDAPTFKLAVNNLHSSMAVTLEQNEQAADLTVDDIETEADEILTTEDNVDILADLAAAAGIGPNTNADVNNELIVMSYYGSFQELLTESGEVMLTEADEIIMVSDGYPQGRPLFTGYMPEWVLDLGSSGDTAIPILTHSQELVNIPLMTPDTEQISTSKWASQNDYLGIKGAGPGDNETIGASFTMNASVNNNGVKLGCRANYAGVIATVSLYAGADPTSLGALLAQSMAQIPYSTDDTSKWYDVNFIWDQIALTNLSGYTLLVEVNVAKTGGSEIYPLQVKISTDALTGGVLKVQDNLGNWGVADASHNLLFTLWKPGGQTTVNYTGVPPANIAKQMIDYARKNGSRINYAAGSIADTGTTVNLTLNTKTVEQGLLEVVKACPSDWFAYIDPATNIFYLQPRPSAPTKFTTKGRTTVQGKVKRSILNLVNDELLSGAGTPPLFVRNTDQSSINQWRRGLATVSNQGVSDNPTAKIVTQSDIDRNNDARYSGTVTDAPKEYEPEDVVLGELLGYIGYGALIDALELQIVDFTYHPNTYDATLDTLLPPVEKRVDDLKRQLEELQQQDNPTTPTNL